MALVGIELETLVSEPDALTTRPPPCASETKKSEAKQQRVFKQNTTRACQKMLRTSVDYNSSTKAKDIA